MDQAILDRIKSNMFPEEAAQATPAETITSESDPQSEPVDAPDYSEEPEEAATGADESPEPVQLETESEEPPTDNREEPERWTLEEVAESLEMDVDDLLNDWEIDLGGERVRLAELKRGNLRESDYTKKTMALSDERKAWEAEKSQQSQRLEQELTVAGNLIQAAEQQLMHDYNQANMDQLKSEDREEWLIKDSEFRQRAQGIKQLRDYAIEQYNNMRTAKSQNAPQELAKLKEIIPEFRDPEKFETSARRIADYAMNLGYSDQDIAEIYDHKWYVMAHKAMKYDELQSKKPEIEKRAKSVPKVLKPKGRKPKEPVEAKRNQDLRRRLKKSGKVNDLASLIRDDLLKEYG